MTRQDVERRKSIRDSPSDFLFLFMRRANQVAYLFSLRVLRIESRARVSLKSTFRNIVLASPRLTRV